MGGAFDAPMHRTTSDIYMEMVVILSGHYSKVFTVSTVAVVCHQENWCGR
jgi:hypothetical protein